MGNNIGESFVQESVIGLGLLSGMGVSVNGEILKAISLSPTLIFLISLFTTIVSLLGAFVIGGWAGIIAVVFAFIGGIFISTKFGAWMLVIGIILGFFSPNMK